MSWHILLCTLCSNYSKLTGDFPPLPPSSSINHVAYCLATFAHAISWVCTTLLHPYPMSPGYSPDTQFRWPLLQEAFSDPFWLCESFPAMTPLRSRDCICHFMCLSLPLGPLAPVQHGSCLISYSNLSPSTWNICLAHSRRPASACRMNEGELCHSEATVFLPLTFWMSRNLMFIKQIITLSLPCPWML